MGYLRITLLLALLFLSASPVLAQNHALLVDRSGSMVPYYERGLITDLGNIILSTLKPYGGVQVVAFSTEAQNVGSLDGVAALSPGSNTYLDRAIEHALHGKYAIAWMITDNIESQAGGAEAGNTEVFYEKLRSDLVKKVIIFPLPQPAGTPGIAIYAVLLSPASEAIFDKEIAEFQSNVKGAYQTEALQMKPLNINTVDVKIERSSLDNRRGKPYEEGQKVRESFDIRFKSKFNHLKINDAQIEVPNLDADFGPESVLQHGKPVLAITPTKVKSLDPLGETEELYTVEADLAEVRVKKDPKSLWKAAFGQSKEKHVMTLKFLIKVPRQSFKFKDQFLDKYNASSLDMARSTGKIYGIQDLPSLLTEQTTPITSQIDLPVEVKYPLWPSVVLMFFFLLVGAILVGGVWLISGQARGLIKSNRWTVEAQKEFGPSIPCELGKEGEVIVASAPVGRITGGKFRPADGVTVLDEAEQKQKISLHDGLRLKLKPESGAVFILIFETSDKAQQEGEPHTPGRR